MYIYLVFSKTGTWLSNVIRVFSRTKYVHVSLGLDETLNTMYSFGRIKPDNPFSGGFVQEDVNGGVYKKNKDSEFVVYRVKISEHQYELLLEELKNYSDLSDTFRYNFLGLFAAGANFPLKRERHYFCSQFVSQLLMKIELLNIEKPPELVRPNDLLLYIEQKEQLFEGYIRDYIALHNNE